MGEDRVTEDEIVVNHNQRGSYALTDQTLFRIFYSSVICSFRSDASDNSTALTCEVDVMCY